MGATTTTPHAVQEIQCLVAQRWDYLPEVADVGVTPTYREYFATHSFPRFVNPTKQAPRVNEEDTQAKDQRPPNQRE